MARSKRAPQHVEPEEESQDIEEPEEEAEDESEPEKASISKTDAIRAALIEGKESPEDGTEFIRKRFGIEISRQHFSATKSQIKKKDGAVAPKGKRTPRGEKTPAPRATPAARPSAAGPDMIGDLETVKSLVKKLGAEQVRRIVGLFED